MQAVETRASALGLEIIRADDRWLVIFSSFGSDAGRICSCATVAGVESALDTFEAARDEVAAMVFGMAVPR